MDQIDFNFEFENMCAVIKQLAPCMDDYLYVYDLDGDCYYISEKAVERFDIPSNCFTDVGNNLKKLVHPEDWELLSEDLKALLSGERTEHNIRYRWLGKQQEALWISCQGRVILDEENKPKYLVGCVNEIGGRQVADNVSGLLETTAVEKMLNSYTNCYPKGFILRIGVDGFKNINERFGMEYGDWTLHEIADCIRRCLKPGQAVYRVVSDEFIIIDFMGGSVGEANELYRAIRVEVDRLIERNHYEAVYTISGGILDTQDMEKTGYSEILKMSQFTLSEAKERGRNQVYRFNVEDYNKFTRERMILAALHKSVANGCDGFEIYFQPVVDVNTENCYGAEALLRFHLSETEMVSPIEFIPILEESGLIIPVGKWVLRQALAMCKECRKIDPEFRVSVNLSYVQILKSAITEEIMGDLRDSGVGSNGLLVELTESGFLESTATIRRVWECLKENGVSIALDDFGTGYSNLQSISSLTPNVVKIDRGFTVKALNNEYQWNLLANIIQMVHSLSIRICIEGIETEEELNSMKTLGPDYIQGYYYGKPMPREDFLTYMVG
ncbi:MAG: GGDEF and EAL domain-containing protein [Agathobacter sp.]|nr:GGDEF and EAL domain-containing protein [Agathobacter sp.]